MAATPRVRFYFDFISHNAALAWFRLQHLAGDWGFTVQPVPVVFAGFLKEYNQMGPAEVPPKNRWMMKNVMRKAVVMGLPPMQPPAIHPFNPLLSLRVASNQWGSPRTQNAVISALFQAVWFESQDVTQPGVVARCVSQALAATGETGAAASVSPEEVLALRNDVEMKNRLHFATEDAIARGVFGVPTMEVVSEADGGSPDAPGEMFFGFDDLPYMQMFLDGKDPIQGVDLTEWAGIEGHHRKR